MHAWLAGRLALILYMWRFMRRHKTLRALIVWPIGILLIAYIVYGDVAIEVAFLLIQLGLQLGFAVVFMVIQFVALFWFISRTRTTVIRPGDPKTVTLDMYWGQPNLVKLMTEWLHLLNEPDEFKKMGGKYISGILLHGPPGTGKTMLAKALAGQGGVGFIGCEGSGFRGMFFGPQPISAKVLSVDGWKNMGDIRVGDLVLNRHSKPVAVLAVHDFGRMGIYEIYLKNGRRTHATAEHPWCVRHQYSYLGEVILQTKDLQVGIYGDQIPFIDSESAWPNQRYGIIDHVAYDGEDEVRCISIDDPNGLYVTDDYILTHNTDTMKVMQFFGNAKKMAQQYGACIGYIDELDAIGASRGGVQGGGQVMGLMGGMGGMGTSGALTRLLYEMDGLGEVSDWENCQNAARKWLGLPEIPRGTVLIMGSTNRRDVLDPALMRPGRFDQIVQVDPPDKKGREAVIRGYLATVKHDDTIDVDVLVSSTAWATPAKIASAITKTSVRYAIFDNRDAISQKDIEKALIEQAVGIAQPVADMDEKQLEQIAYHESGHAIAEYHLCPHRKIAYLTITRRSEALGFMLPVSKTDIYAMPLEHIVADIQVSLAGHVATEIALGKAWTGASSDFEQVRARIYYLASLGYLGFFQIDTGSDHSQEIDSFIKRCLDATRTLLTKHRKELNALAQALLERRDMSGEEVVGIIGKTKGKK